MRPLFRLPFGFERPLGFQAGGEALGAALRGDSSADTQGHIFRLRRGVQRCDGACCSWTVGLLEHGSTYLERACFGRDDEGARLTELTLVDG